MPALAWYAPCFGHLQMPTSAARSRRPARPNAGWPLVVWIGSRVLAVLAVLELVYLIAANALMSFGGVKRLVETTDDLKLDFASGYSLWPGHVSVKNLHLRAEDHNVEFSVQVETATVQIAISDLFQKRFHATSVRTTGTVYKMRHHVDSVGDKGARLAAYPSIPGFPDPPLYRAPDQPGPTDEDYNLWEIQLEDVHAEIAEVWILEYRYQGPGRATGRFHLRPARWFEVGPAAFEVDGGRLTVNDRPVSKRTTGRIDCFAEHTDVQNVSGLAVLAGVSAGVHLSLEDMDLSFADVYTEVLLGAQVVGRGSGRIDIDVKKAALVPGGRVEFSARPLDVRKGKVHFGGPVDLTVRVAPESAANGVLAEVRSKELIGAVRDKQTPSPSAHGLLARAVIEPRDLREDLEVTSTELAVKRFEAPALAWFDPLFGETLRLSGSAKLQGGLRTTRAKGVDADVEATFERLGVELEDTWFRSESGSVDAALRSAAGQPERLDVEDFTVNVKDLTLKKGDGHTPPLTARVTGEDVHVDSLSPFAARGVLHARGGPADALLPLLIEPAFLRSVAGAALGLDSIDARAAFRTSAGAQRVELLDVRSGKLKARGLWQKTPKNKPEGAFLVSAGDVNLGVKVRDEKTDVKPFAGDDWLPGELARLARADAGSGKGLQRAR